MRFLEQSLQGINARKGSDLSELRIYFAKWPRHVFWEQDMMSHSENHYMERNSWNNINI